MAVARFTIKSGDTRPLLVARLREHDPDTGRLAPMDLSGVTDFLLAVRHRRTGHLVVDGADMVLESVGDARLTYEFAEDDTPELGRHEAVVRLVFSPTERQTVPTEGYVRVDVEDPLL